MSGNPTSLFGDSGLNSEEAQKERLEYVKNIGIEYRYGCYEEKRAESCHLLGDYREAIEQNFKAAFELYKENCEVRKYSKSCFKFAKYLASGRGDGKISFEKAVPPLTIACDDNNAEACKLLSLIYWNGHIGGKPDSEKAVELQKRSCDRGNGEACWILSTWFMGPSANFKRTAGDRQKNKGVVERDMEKAIEYGSRACDLNIYQSCANMMRVYKVGDGVAKDPDKAKEYYSKAKDIVQYLKDQAGTGFTA